VEATKKPYDSQAFQVIFPLKNEVNKRPSVGDFEAGLDTKRWGKSDENISKTAGFSPRSS